MTKIKLTETELTNLISRMIREQATSGVGDMEDQKDKDEDMKDKGYVGERPTADEWDKMSREQKKAFKVFEKTPEGSGGKKVASAVKGAQKTKNVTMHKQTVEYVKRGGDTLTPELYVKYMKKPPLVKNLIVLKPMVKNFYQQVEKAFTKCKEGCNDAVVAEKLMRTMKRFSQFFGTDLSTVDSKSVFFPNKGGSGSRKG